MEPAALAWSSAGAIGLRWVPSDCDLQQRLQAPVQ